VCQRKRCDSAEVPALKADKVQTRFASSAPLALALLILSLSGARAHAVDPLPGDTLILHQAHGGTDPLFDDHDEESEHARNFPDPLENTNRGVLRFNGGVDRWLLDPITATYGFVFPGPIKRSIRRFLDNINSPAIMVNDLLQREWQDAGTTTGRLVVNTTVGIGGLFDPAARLGMPRHQSDFGQTLALAGMPSGPFLMLPVLGPNTTRDTFGGIVDMFLRPTTLLLAPGTQIIFNTIEGGTSGIVKREANIQAIRALRDSSVDYYAALRNAYYQDRVAQIWAGREHHRAIAAEDKAPEGVETVEAPSPARNETRVVMAHRFLRPGH
jgi:phospholipid-binding lipoprotein MlaA